MGYMNGEIETGKTLHMMTSGIDEGSILDQNRIPLFLRMPGMMFLGEMI